MGRLHLQASFHALYSTSPIYIDECAIDYLIEISWESEEEKSSKETNVMRR